MTRPVLLITGGARGIGAAICRKFARTGYDILLNYHWSRQQAQELTTELSSVAKVLSFQSDISMSENVESLFEYCSGNFGRIDVLINNASYSTEAGWNATIEDFRWDEWQRTIEVDVKGTMLCSHSAYKRMKIQGRGKIINFSSAAALWGDVPTYFYTAAKSAVAGLTKTMAKAFAPEVQVNCIAPGSIATDWIKKWKLTAGEQVEIAEENPSKRIGKPEEVAQLALFLASPECNFLTGQVIAIDGGILTT